MKTQSTLSHDKHRACKVQRCAFLLLLLPILFLNACSTYKTNSSLRFTDRFPREKPVIPVGKLDTGNENLTYLGWVNAEVSKPLPMASPPTKQQADLVLAELGSKLDADAVTFVKYKTGLGGNTLFAKGQAVQFKNRPQQPIATNRITQSVPAKTSSMPAVSLNLPSQSRVAATRKPSRYKAREEKRLRQLTDDEIALIISNALYIESQSANMQRKDMELSAKVIRDLIEKSKKTALTK